MKINSQEFYDRFFVAYEAYAEGRRAYLSAVDDIISKKISTRGSVQTVADIGCGTATRSIHIARTLSIPHITLVDSSNNMLLAARRHTGASIFCEDVSRDDFSLNGTHDAVLCLWNVLGHVATEDARICMLRNLARLLSSHSFLFLDVNNRYNFSEYGFVTALRNMIFDLLPFRRHVGDFVARIPVGQELLETTVHLFSPREMKQLLKKAGLKIIEQYAINYRTGRIMKNKYAGQLFYVLALP